MDKQKDGEYRRTLSDEAKPFVALQANKDKVNYFNEEKQRKSPPDSRLRSTITIDLPDNYSTYKKEEELSADAWINQLSVHGININVNGPSIKDMVDATELQRIQIPVSEGSPTK